MARVYNFSAGPSMLPEAVLKEAAAEMLDYQGTGMSVMEMSHRSKAFDNIIKEAEATLSQVSGLRRHMRKLRSTERQMQLLHLQTRPSHTFLIAQIFLLMRTLIMYTFVIIIQYTVQHITSCLIQRVRFLWQT